MEKYLILYLISAVWMCLSIWAVVTIAKYPRTVRTKKLVWTNVVVLFPFAGLLVFHLMGKKNLAEG